MSRTSRFAVLLLMALPLSAQSAEKSKPECTERTRGKLWPEKTARGADVPVEICAPKGWRFRWQQLTVDISQLRAAAKKKEVLASLKTPEAAPVPRE